MGIGAAIATTIAGLFISTGVSVFARWAFAAKAAFGIGEDLPPQLVTTSPDTRNSFSKGKIYTIGARISQAQGFPVPIAYGVHRVGGNIINVQLEEDVAGGGISSGTIYRDLDITYQGIQFSLLQTVWHDYNPDHCTYENPYTYFEGSQAIGEAHWACNRMFRILLNKPIDSIHIRAKGKGDWYFVLLPINKWPTTNDEWDSYYWNYGIYLGCYTYFSSDWGGSAEFQAKVPRNQYYLGIFHLNYNIAFDNDYDTGWEGYPPNCLHYIEWIRGDEVDIDAAPLEYHQKIKVLMAMSEGPISNLSQEEIGGQKLSNYSDSVVALKKRLGTHDQSPINGFIGTTHTTNKSDTLNYNSDVVHSGTINNANEIRIKVYAENGIYKFSKSQYSEWTVKVKVRYRISGGSWVSAGALVMKGSSPKPFYRYLIIDDLASNTYDVKLTRITADPNNDTKFGTIKFVQVDEIEYGDKSYPYTSLLGITFKSGKQLSGNLPNITTVVKGKTIKTPYMWMQSSGTAYVEQPFSTLRYSSVTGYMFGGSAAIWSGAALDEQYSNNPAWVTFDLLTNKRYGLGEIFDESIMNKQSFFEAGAYCDEWIWFKPYSGTAHYEKRYELDIVLDSQEKGMDIVKQLMVTYGGFLVWKDGEVHLKVDKPSDPVQLFTMGNIVKGSFEIQYLDYIKSPNSISIQFANKENNWEKDTMVFEDQSLISEYGRVPQSISLFGVTRPSQIERTARYLLNVSKYVRQGVSFEAGIDSIHCEVGDVINVQHDVPQWSDGGRIINATVTHVYLDKEISIGTGDVYQIMCRLTGDDLEAHTIDPTISGYVWDVTLTGSFSKVPPQNSLWAIGIQNTVTKPFKIVSMERQGNENMRINSLEYHSEVYDWTPSTASESNYSYASPPSSIPAQITGLHLEVETDYYAAILVDWNLKDDSINYYGSDVYVKTNDDDDWGWYKTVLDKTNTRYSPVIVGRSYKFRVVSFNRNREYASFLGAPSASIDINMTGIYIPPEISNLRIDNS
ncbi:MAG: phage tail protein [Candidatus Helarchaeota archaeon]